MFRFGSEATAAENNREFSIIYGACLCVVWENICCDCLEIVRGKICDVYLKTFRSILIISHISRREQVFLPSETLGTARSLFVYAIRPTSKSYFRGKSAVRHEKWSWKITNWLSTGNAEIFCYSTNHKFLFPLRWTHFIFCENHMWVIRSLPFTSSAYRFSFS